MMNKDSIYKIIGYRGEYSDSVKKALKKILKDNHPDRGGDVEIFKIINEVKKELENNKVSFKYFNKKEQSDSKFSDIDFEFCEKMIKKIQKEIELMNEKIETYDIKISSLNSNYKKIYQNSLKEREYLLNNNTSMKELRHIKDVSLLILIIALITFVIAVIKNNMIIYSIFALMSFMLIFIIGRYFVTIRNIAKNNENNLHKYIKTTSNLSLINEKKEKLSLDRLHEEQKKKRLENDLRFYNNLIKYK